MRNMQEFADSLNQTQLKGFAKKIGVKGYSKADNTKLKELVDDVLSQRFVEIDEKLGKPGKEGIAKIVWDQKDRIHRVKKQFRSAKSGNTLTKEGTLQNKASEHGISPKVLEIDVERKHLIMEKMHPRTLMDIISENNKSGKELLTTKQQNEILDLFRKLDKAGIFHGDPNPLNFLRFPPEYPNKKLVGKFGMIDYGFGKFIEGAKELKMYNGKPNEMLMTVGLLVILKKRGYEASRFPVLFNSVSKAARVQFELK
jgi:tRNA A-37 threonylcarbamoyl transferase component Bud32